MTQRKKRKSKTPLDLTDAKAWSVSFSCRCCSVSRLRLWCQKFKEKQGFLKQESSCHTGNYSRWLRTVILEISQYLTLLISVAFFSYRSQEQFALSGPMYIWVSDINKECWNIARAWKEKTSYAGNVTSSSCLWLYECVHSNCYWNMNQWEEWPQSHQ